MTQKEVAHRGDERRPEGGADKLGGEMRGGGACGVDGKGVGSAAGVFKPEEGERERDTVATREGEGVGTCATRRREKEGGGPSAAAGGAMPREQGSPGGLTGGPRPQY
jgi:hypothetical protein